MQELQAPIFEEKVVDFILEMAKVDDKTVSLDDLMKDPEEAPKKAAAKTKALGGQVLYENKMPGVVEFAVLMDPQGAVFGIAHSLMECADPTYGAGAKN